MEWGAARTQVASHPAATLLCSPPQHSPVLLPPHDKQPAFEGACQQSGHSSRLRRLPMSCALPMAATRGGQWKSGTPSPARQARRAIRQRACLPSGPACQSKVFGQQRPRTQGGMRLGQQAWRRARPGLTPSATILALHSCSSCSLCASSRGSASACTWSPAAPGRGRGSSARGLKECFRGYETSFLPHHCYNAAAGTGQRGDCRKVTARLLAVSGRARLGWGTGPGTDRTETSVEPTGCSDGHTSVACNSACLRCMPEWRAAGRRGLSGTHRAGIARAHKVPRRSNLALDAAGKHLHQGQAPWQ